MKKTKILKNKKIKIKKKERKRKYEKRTKNMMNKVGWVMCGLEMK